jgi:chromosome condensin MukBEF complex kleisin-like MukF subunit
MSSPYTVTMEFDSIDKLKEFLDKRTREISAELAEIIKKLEVISSMVEAKRRLMSLFKVQTLGEPPKEGVKITEDTTLYIDPPPEVLSDIYENLNNVLNKKLNAYRNLKNAVAQIPSSNVPINITLVLENDFPKYLLIRPK